MLDPQGGFSIPPRTPAARAKRASALSVWAADQVREVLDWQADQLIATYGVRTGSNWEGENILTMPHLRATV